jgi:hypothetical protein
MTKIANKKVSPKKVPLVSDAFFGSDNDDEGNIVRFDMEAVAALIKQLNGDITATVSINSYFPSGW